MITMIFYDNKYSLKKLIRTENGSALNPSHTKGIRYYVSQQAIKHEFSIHQRLIQSRKFLRLEQTASVFINHRLIFRTKIIC